jgi:hypothetical protein
MKTNKNLVFAAVIMILATALYRIFPNRPGGFAPQIAVALFAGSLFVKDKKWAFVLPLLSMVISDGLYQLLYINGLTDIQGFYKGQWVNYLLILSTTCFGFFARENKPASIVGAAVGAPTYFFLLSNFMVWMGNGGLKRPKTFEGLMQCYNDALPFYRNSLIAALVFTAIFFGTYAWAKKARLLQQA